MLNLSTHHDVGHYKGVKATTRVLSSDYCMLMLIADVISDLLGHRMHSQPKNVLVLLIFWRDVPRNHSNPALVMQFRTS